MSTEYQSLIIIKNFADGEYVDGNNQVIIYDFKTDKYSLYLNDALAENEVRTVTKGRRYFLMATCSLKKVIMQEHFILTQTIFKMDTC